MFCFGLPSNLLYIPSFPAKKQSRVTYPLADVLSLFQRRTIIIILFHVVTNYPRKLQCRRSELQKLPTYPERLTGYALNFLFCISLNLSYMWVCVDLAVAKLPQKNSTYWQLIVSYYKTQLNCVQVHIIRRININKSKKGNSLHNFVILFFKLMQTLKITLGTKLMYALPLKRAYGHFFSKTILQNCFIIFFINSVVSSSFFCCFKEIRNFKH